MLLNLQTAGRGASHLASVEATMTTAPAEPSPWTKRIDAYSNVPEPIDSGLTDIEPIDTEPVDIELLDFEPSTEPEIEAAASETATATELEPEIVLGDTEDASAFAPEIEPYSEPVAVEEAETEIPRALLRPGPGLIPRRVERPQDEQVGPPFWDDAWEEPPIEEEQFDDVPPDADLAFAAEDLPADLSEEAEKAEAPEVEADEIVGVENVPILAEEIPTPPTPVVRSSRWSRSSG